MFDQKFVVALVALVSILILVMTGKTDGATAVSFIKYLTGFYLGSLATVQAAQKIALGKSVPSLSPSLPESMTSHAAIMKSLGVIVPPKAEPTLTNFGSIEVPVSTVEKK
jgi:hypothetical protein